MFALVFAVLFLSMSGLMVRSLCGDSRARYYGPLDGSVYVTDENGNAFMSYKAASAIAEGIEAVTGISAIREYDVFFSNTEYIGQGDFQRKRYSGEKITESGYLDILKGVHLCGITSMDILSEVYGEKLYILEGSVISEEDNDKRLNKIVISDSFAEKNGLTLGSELSLATMSLFWDEKTSSVNKPDAESHPYIYTVGGIYKNQEDNFGTSDNPNVINDNRVYVTLSSVEDIALSEYVQRFYTRTNSFAPIKNPILIPDQLYFRLSDIGLKEALEDELSSLGFIKGIKLTEYVSDASISPSARLSRIISILVTGILFIGFSVFLLVLFFNLNARQKELAILTALGKSRSRVSGSFFCEVFVLLLLSSLAGLAAFCAVTSVCAIPITRYLNAAEISSKITNITSSQVLLGDSGGEWAINRMADFSYLFDSYILPSSLVTAGISLLMISAAYIFIYIYVRRINPLSAIGGKE